MALRSARPHIISVLLFALVLALIPSQVQAGGGITIPSLEEFTGIVQNGEGDTLRGVYMPEVFAHEVVPQPSDEPGYVSSEENTITQFSLASQAGSTGLLAHNYLAGKHFFKVRQGQVFYLVYGDGRTESYVVTEIQRFQALDPESVWSNFLDLRRGNVISSSELFSQVYGQSGNVILQTCIFARGDVSWGRLFVIAEPHTVSTMGGQSTNTVR
jgi:hypothetical protein